MNQRAEPVFYCKEQLPSKSSFFLSPLPQPAHLVRAYSEVRSICAGHLGTSQTIRFFFQILNRTGIDKHALFREKFWRRYLEAGFITQSWLILAPGAEETARKELSINPWQYGKIHKTRRVDAKHAVLLMRLDHLVIAEWSHVGKCRAWFHGNLNAPRLFRSVYSRGELTDYSDYIQQHYFSAKGLWQKDLSSWMSARAQIPVCLDQEYFY